MNTLFPTRLDLPGSSDHRFCKICFFSPIFWVSSLETLSLWLTLVPRLAERELGEEDMRQMSAVAHNTGETTKVAHGRPLKWNKPPLGAESQSWPRSQLEPPTPKPGPAEIHYTKL